MSNFGESFPAFWDDTKTQSFAIDSMAPSVVGVSAILTYLNEHTYELGMMLFLNVTYSAGPAFQEFVYVIAKTDFTVTVAVPSYFSTIGFLTGRTTGYIGLENNLYDVVVYKDNVKLRRRSIVNRKWNVKNKGSYSNFELTVNLLNMVDINRINLSKLLDNIQTIETLVFYPHVDRDNLKDSLGVSVYFDVEVNFKYIDRNDYRDQASIIVRSNEFTSLEQNIG